MDHIVHRTLHPTLHPSVERERRHPLLEKMPYLRRKHHDRVGVEAWREARDPGQEEIVNLSGSRESARRSRAAGSEALNSHLHLVRGVLQGPSPLPESVHRRSVVPESSRRRRVGIGLTALQKTMQRRSLGIDRRKRDINGRRGRGVQVRRGEPIKSEEDGEFKPKRQRGCKKHRRMLRSPPVLA